MHNLVIYVCNNYLEEYVNRSFPKKYKTNRREAKNKAKLKHGNHDDERTGRGYGYQWDTEIIKVISYISSHHYQQMMKEKGEGCANDFVRNLCMKSEREFTSMGRIACSLKKIGMIKVAGLTSENSLTLLNTRCNGVFQMGGYECDVIAKVEQC
ncbi:hypothetical protein MTR_1g041805 [Medicago truncatula]|uniref:Uncharacterized protein n=1 Tax=Medicago truncatula TaxID=3880 RepID=A0A072VI34_MEDTR|nr:hypothetical protein MTR_1g041805 [Medicago truncatula]